MKIGQYWECNIAKGNDWQCYNSDDLQLDYSLVEVLAKIFMYITAIIDCRLFDSAILFCFLYSVVFFSCFFLHLFFSAVVKFTPGVVTNSYFYAIIFFVFLLNSAERSKWDVFQVYKNQLFSWRIHYETLGKHRMKAVQHYTKRLNQQICFCRVLFSLQDAAMRPQRSSFGSGCRQPVGQNVCVSVRSETLLTDAFSFCCGQIMRFWINNNLLMIYIQLYRKGAEGLERHQQQQTLQRKKRGSQRVRMVKQ